jgi:hypothetical protein
MSEPRIIELHLDLELVDPENAVLPKERHGPVTLRITPAVSIVRQSGVPEVQFRVEFEPENTHRRNQPLRSTLKEVFPDGWRHGDAWNGNDW